MSLSEHSEDALVGNSGLIGGVLSGQRTFATTARSTTIKALEGRSFDTVFIAAARGSMLEANKFPDRDAAHILDLTQSLSRIKAKRAVLISTIAVLESFDGGFDETTGRFREDLAYGRHRRMLEVSTRKLYPEVLIVRLPALFGAGIKKNFVFDLMNPVPSMLTLDRHVALRAAMSSGRDIQLARLYDWSDSMGMWILDRARLNDCPERKKLEEAVIESGFEAARFVHPESTFQYYDLRRLSRDIDTALIARCDVLHLAPAPVTAARVHERLTGRPMPETGARRHAEDMRTVHAELFGAAGPYLNTTDEVLNRLAGWVAEQGGAQ